MMTREESGMNANKEGEGLEASRPSARSLTATHHREGGIWDSGQLVMHVMNSPHTLLQIYP